MSLIPWFTLATGFICLHRALGWRLPLRGVGKLLRRIDSDRVLYVDGLRMYMDHRLATCYLRQLAGEFNEPETHCFFSRVLGVLPPEAQVHVVDVGANIGEIALDVARCPQVTSVVAFEPYSECARVLAINARLNGLEGKIAIRPVAVCEQVGSVRFQAVPANAVTSSIVRGDAAGQMVPGTTLDAELNDFQGWAILKIDVEGYEIDVLRGGRDFLARVRPLILFEYIEDARPSYSLDEVQRLLGENWNIYRLRGDGRLDAELKHTWNCVAVHADSPFAAICDKFTVSLANRGRKELAAGSS